MTNYRLKRVAEQIQEEISSLLLKGTKDPRIGFVTITGVEISPDMSRAYVHFCTTGQAAEKEASLEGLQSAASFLRRAIGKRLRLRSIPELQFKYDNSLDQGDRIERLLDEIHEQEGRDDPTRVRGSAAEVAEALKQGQNFLVTSHTNPDGDAIASLLALGHLLTALGKTVVLYHPDPVPFNFRFLPGAESIRSEPGTGPYDVTVVVDCSDLERVGKLPPTESLGKLVGIDHHLTALPLGEAHLLDPSASAIGELVFLVIEALGLEPGLELCTCIYCSILSDTGSFRYSNVTPRALRTAASMLERGVDPWEVARQVYEAQPAERLQLLTRVLETVELGPENKYASILITEEMIALTHASLDMVDGFINYPRTIQGVEVAIQFREVGVDKYKVSFRSQGNINVAAISQSFGGGGHKNAAGCTLFGPLSEVRKQIYQAVEATLAE